jgi:hypothetical protein
LNFFFLGSADSETLAMCSINKSEVDCVKERVRSLFRRKEDHSIETIFLLSHELTDSITKVETPMYGWIWIAFFFFC